MERLHDRRALLRTSIGLRRQIDRSASIEAMDRYGQQALEMLIGQPGAAAFDLSSEPEPVRDRYGKHLWCQQALLARRLVEAGVAFVTIDLSYHTSSGTWDTHGDNIPPYGGISKGLKPLLPIFDHLITTLVSDLGQRGLLDDVLVIAMGEFGRTPMMGTQGSTDGRNHWAVVMSMALAGGGLTARPGDRGDRARRRLHQGSPRHAGRPGRDDLPAHGRAAGRHLSRHDRPASLHRRTWPPDRRIVLIARVVPMTSDEQGEIDPEVRNLWAPHPMTTIIKTMLATDETRIEHG